MDNDNFLNSFMNVNILSVEAVSEIVGRVIAKLRNGMVEGGMSADEADALISSVFEIFFTYMAKLGGRSE